MTFGEKTRIFELTIVAGKGLDVVVEAVTALRGLTKNRRRVATPKFSTSRIPPSSESLTAGNFRKSVRKFSKKRSSNVENVPKKRPKARHTPVRNAATAEMIFWKSIRKIHSKKKFERFLKMWF